MALEVLQKSVEALLGPQGFELHPFKIGWYNEKVQSIFYLPYHKDTIAFCVLSTPSMYEKAFLPYVRSLTALTSRDPLDDCVAHQYQCLKESLPDYKIETIQDYELHPNRRPKVLVQTVGHVAGAAYYYQRSDMKHDPWGEKKIFGVSIHPKYGGWFAFRGILIFPEVQLPLVQRDPPNVIKTDDALKYLLDQFNDNWKENKYRDCIDVVERYSQEQIEYFMTPPSQRGKLLGFSADETIAESVADRFH
ncbi:cyanocobalamin reductase / alkylcobalamin dealkylase-like [Patiria miniata]|uniref:Cyanocobalamin reductase (cyanide-eliminating) n=1 Tax=Patiria miniata TaxID=46514 RepID=A0A913ZFA2_PATMI|nr:cyanocobalamin reductase / alkylcobalamin dealkylase-like [Patiria miniata]